MVRAATLGGELPKVGAATLGGELPEMGAATLGGELPEVGAATLGGELPEVGAAILPLACAEIDGGERFLRHPARLSKDGRLHRQLLNMAILWALWSAWQ